MHKIRYLLISCLFLLSQAVSASEQLQVDKVIASNEPVFGVVFEIVGGDAESLQRAISRINAYHKQLEKAHPDVLVVIVTHGYEQFTLIEENEAETPDLHSQVQSIVKDDRVSVQVCGTFADMMGVQHDEFPDYIDVVEQGPAQIQAYEHEGYKVIYMDLSL